MESEIVRVLVVDDDRGDFLLTKKMLSQAREGRYQADWAASYEEGRDALSRGEHDICLIDYRLGEKSGLSLLRESPRDLVDAPVILLTGQGDREIDLDAMRAGASDYLVKGRIDTDGLERALRYALERQRAQIALERSRQEQLRLKDEFLSHVSHELSSPLAASRQFVTVVLDGLLGSLVPEQDDCLRDALRNIDHLRSMIDDLLDATRSSCGKVAIRPYCIQPEPILLDVIRSFEGAAAAKSIRISADIQSDIPFVHADPVRFRQVLVALTNNALKFTPEEGRITIRAGAADEEGEAVRVTVEDTGTGIRQEEKDRVFDYLYQSPSNAAEGRKGLGLGLFICRDLITRQNGRIWVESDCGRGCSVHFTLPRSEPLLKLAQIAAEKPSGLLIVSATSARSSATGSDLGDAARDRFRRAVESAAAEMHLIVGPEIRMGEEAALSLMIFDPTVESAKRLIPCLQVALIESVELRHAGLKIRIWEERLKRDGRVGTLELRNEIEHSLLRTMSKE